MIVGMPYLRAIELQIKDAFPTSKVGVFCEESPFFPTKCAVSAYVDRYGAYVTLDASEGVTERYISERLISMIKDEMERNKKMMNFENEKTCSVEEPKRETAKELLEDMDSILKEMENHVAMISDAVYRGGEKNVEKGPALTNEPCATPPMVVMMRKQRDDAERLLKEIIKIRDALW